MFKPNFEMIGAPTPPNLDPSPLTLLPNDPGEFRPYAELVPERAQEILSYMAGFPEEGYILRRSVIEIREGGLVGWVSPQRLINEALGIDKDDYRAKRISKLAFRELEQKDLIKVERTKITKTGKPLNSEKSNTLRLNPVAILSANESTYVTSALISKIEADIEERLYKAPTNVEAVSEYTPKPKPQRPTTTDWLSGSGMEQIVLDEYIEPGLYPTIPPLEIDLAVEEFIEDEGSKFDYDNYRLAPEAQEAINGVQTYSAPVRKPSELSAINITDDETRMRNSIAIARAIRRGSNKDAAFRAPNADQLHEKIARLVNETDIEVVEQAMALMRTDGYVKHEEIDDVSLFILTPHFFSELAEYISRKKAQTE